ncbi:MAG: hypothetical protein OHK0024_19070 [Thalassobaculales bacterium]
MSANILPVTATLVGLAVATAGLSGLALAQPGRPQAGPGPGPMAGICADGPARLAGHLAYVEAKLGITAAERPAFQDFASRATAAAAAIDAVCPSLAPPATPLPADERLARMARLHAAMSQALESLRVATADLLPALRPDQREILAAIVLPGPPHMLPPVPPVRP